MEMRFSSLVRLVSKTGLNPSLSPSPLDVVAASWWPGTELNRRHESVLRRMEDETSAPPPGTPSRAQVISRSGRARSWRSPARVMRVSRTSSWGSSLSAARCGSLALVREPPQLRGRGHHRAVLQTEPMDRDLSDKVGRPRHAENARGGEANACAWFMGWVMSPTRARYCRGSEWASPPPRSRPRPRPRGPSTHGRSSGGRPGTRDTSRRS